MSLRELLDELRFASKTAVVVVEGKRDKEALRKLGIDNVITIAGKRLTDLGDILEGKTFVIPLFDLDAHGERIHQKVVAILSSQGYILKSEYRDKLRQCGVIYVEDLYEKVRSLEKPAGAG
ncbi:toprim domain-containing protein [Thermocrinis sp.]